MSEKVTKVEFQILVSYLEIYNETIIDLLDRTEKRINLKEDPKK